MEAVDRGHREVAALDSGSMPQVAAFKLTIRGPGTLFGTDSVHGPFGVGFPVHFVEDKKFRLGTKESGITQTGALQIRLGTLGNGARVTIIALHGSRLDDVTAQYQGGILGERIEKGSTILRT